MDLTLPNTLKRVFVTDIYTVQLGQTPGLVPSLNDACQHLFETDERGKAWSRDNGYVGYTSYGSVHELSQAAPPFRVLQTLVDTHVTIFARQAELDLGGRPLKMEMSWINRLDHLGQHSNHFHPHSIISGTFYISVPPGTSGLRFEDPRLPLMMNAPARAANARPDRQCYVSISPTPGTLVLWESWLRHEVPVNQAQEPRISISFNYG